MLERLADDSLGEDEDRESVEKYMRDMQQMMEGMLDLHRRNQLPDRERAVCMKLLLRITLKDEIFEWSERHQAQEWLSSIEGTRRRGRVGGKDQSPIARHSIGRGRGKSKYKVKSPREREFSDDDRHSRSGDESIGMFD